MAPNVSDADKLTLAHDNEAFALSAYGALAKTPGNLFFSPYSISSALAMAYAGANGPTATEMATALHFTLPAERLHPAYDQLDLALDSGSYAEGDATPFTLHIANSMWGLPTETWKQPFLDTLAVDYGAGMYLEDFAGDPDGSEAKINQWVSDQTNAKITKVLNHNVTAATKLVLVDAIYFDADWQSQFEKDETSDGSFTTPSGSVTTSMMHSLGTLKATHTATYDAVELPYKGSTVMDIVMPALNGMGAFESTLTNDTLDPIVKGLTSQDVSLAVPKFGYAGDAISLKTMLQGLGMNLAFTNGADFSNITDDPLLITDVLHKAYLRVDEKGTEAAAATAVIFADAGATYIPVPPLAITIDHPFFFTIRDVNTGTILFAGRITDPTK